MRDRRHARSARSRGRGGPSPGRPARPGRRGVRVLAAAIAVAALCASAPATAAPGDTSVFARVAAPGFPAHAYVHPDGRVYEGTYVDRSAVGVPSKVFEYPAAGGAPTRAWTVPGQDTSEGEQGVQVTTSDARGRLVLLDKSPARALLLDRDTGTFSPYATFPDLKPCTTVAYHVDCEPGSADERPMPNYGLWLPDGSLLVTDYQQDVVWRVPPGGGRPTVWLGLDRFRATSFGLAGIELSADRRSVLLMQSSSLGADGLDMLQGELLDVPLLPDLRPGTIRTVWTSGPFDLPDGFAVSRAGNVYAALVGPSASQVVRIGPDGREQARYGLPIVGTNGSPIPFDAPSSAMFQGTRILVANQSAVLGVAANQAILAVETGETGTPELVPAGAGDAPAAPASFAAAPRTRLRVTVTPGRIASGRRTVLRLRVTAPVDGVRRSIRGARVRVLGRSARTDARGRATVAVRATGPRRARVVATASGHRAGRTTLRVRRP